MFFLFFPIQPNNEELKPRLQQHKRKKKKKKTKIKHKHKPRSQQHKTHTLLNTHSLSLTCLYKNSHPYFLHFLKHRFWLFHLFQTNPNLQNFYKPKWLPKTNLAPSTQIRTPRRSDTEKRRRRVRWPDRWWRRWRANGAWRKWVLASRGRFFLLEWSGIQRRCP